MNEVVAWIVTIVVLANVVGGLWLIWWASRGAKTPANQTTHTWDDDLTEYNNPMPRWWLWLFVLTIVFGSRLSRPVPGAR